MMPREDLITDRYRGFVRKGAHVLGHNIITAANPVKVLKDALAHLGPYQTLTGVCGNDPGG
jgi:hypothetical protein